MVSSGVTPYNGAGFAINRDTALQYLKRRLSGSADFQKIMANTSWLVSGQVLRMGIGFVVGIFVARYLGPEQFGALGLAASFAALFTPLAKLGLDQIVIRDIVNEPDRRAALLGTTFGLKLIVGVLLVPLIALVGGLVRPDDARMSLLTLLAALGVVPLAFDAIDFWFQSEVRSKPVVMARNVSYISAVGLRLLGVILTAPLVFFAVVALLELVVYAMGQVVAYRRNGQSIRAWRFDTKLARQLLRESWPLIISGLAVMTYMRIDQTMLGSMLPGEEGTRAVGIYGVAVRLSELWYIIPTAIASSAFPAVVQAKNNDPELYRARMQRLFNLMALISYAVAIPTIFLAGPVVNLYGTEYQEAAPMLVILMWAGLWSNLGVTRNLAIQAENLQVYGMFSTILGAIVNIAANLLLIPHLAGIGASLATLLSQFVAAYASSLLFSPLRLFGRMQTKAIFSLPIRSSF